MTEEIIMETGIGRKQRRIKNGRGFVIWQD